MVCAYADSIRRADWLDWLAVHVGAHSNVVGGGI